MPIDNAVLLNFCNESARSAADRLSGLLQFPGAVVDAFVGQGLPAVVGADAATLTRTDPWTDAEYGAVLAALGGADQDIAGTDAGGRTTLTALDVVKLLRVIIWLRNSIAADPNLSPLIYKFAVNPRA